MRRAIFLLAMLGLPAEAAVGACTTVSAPANAREAAFVRQTIERTPRYLSDLSVPGAAVAIIENGRVILARGFGMADQTHRIPVTAATLFNIGSTSKSISAWGAMRLVEEGKIGLDDAVDRKLTRWHLPLSSYSNHGVTLRRLLSHTAGLSVSGYPDDWNVHDSLGDGYAAGGAAHGQDAIASYRRSLALNPDNGHAREMIERIQRGDEFTM